MMNTPMAPNESAADTGRYKNDEPDGISDRALFVATGPIQTSRSTDTSDLMQTSYDARHATTTVKTKRRAGESATSPRRIKAIEEKQHAALEYRKMGYTYAQIAESVGYAGRQGAYEAIQSALTRVIREPAEDVLRLDLERLDAMFVKPYQNALNGDLAALSACLIIMARRAKLLGLDAPTKQQLSGPGGGAITTVVHNMTSDEMDAAARRLTEKY